jgi:hypothetical protein
MATAKRNTHPPVIPPPATYTLILSEHEASLLTALLDGNVNGSHDGPRGVTSGIGSALRDAGVSPAFGSFRGLVTGAKQ